MMKVSREQRADHGAFTVAVPRLPRAGVPEQGTRSFEVRDPRLTVVETWAAFQAADLPSASTIRSAPCAPLPDGRLAPQAVSVINPDAVGDDGWMA